MPGKKAEGGRTWKNQMDENLLAASYHVEARQPPWGVDHRWGRHWSQSARLRGDVPHICYRGLRTQEFEGIGDPELEVSQ